MSGTHVIPDLDARLRHIEETTVRTATQLDTILPHLATKAELAGIRTEVADVRTDLAKTETRLIRWLLGVGAGAVVVVSAQLWGAVQLLLHVIR